MFWRDPKPTGPHTFIPFLHEPKRWPARVAQNASGKFRIEVWTYDFWDNFDDDIYDSHDEAVAALEEIIGERTWKGVYPP